jgi:hypothetical protein
MAQVALVIGDIGIERGEGERAALALAQSLRDDSLGRGGLKRVPLPARVAATLPFMVSLAAVLAGELFAFSRHRGFRLSIAGRSRYIINEGTRAHEIRVSEYPA